MTSDEPSIGDEPESIALTPIDGSEVVVAEAVVTRRFAPLIGVAIVLLLVAALILSSTRDGETAVPETSAPETSAAPAADDNSSILRAREAEAMRLSVPAVEDYTIVYRTGDSLALLDPVDGSIEVLPWGIPDDVNTNKFTFFSSSRGTWLLDAEDPALAMRLSANAEIGLLSDPASNSVLVEAADGGATVLGGFFDGRSVRILVTIPVSTDAEVIHGRGVLLSPVTGGSFLVESGSPERISDGRIVSANTDWFAEIVCDEGLQCSAFLANWETGERADLPLWAISAAVVEVSPDGRWILAGEGQDWCIFSVAEAVFIDVPAESAPTTPVMWSPDSSFYLWIDELTVSVAEPARPFEVGRLVVETAPVDGLLAGEFGLLPKG